MTTSRLPVLIILLFTLLVYGNALDGSFHYDDVPPIIETQAHHDLRNWVEILTAQRGLSMLSFAVNYAIGGLDVTGYHLFNVLVHALNASLVYLLFAALLRPREEHPVPAPSGPAIVPFFAALMFAVHPLQTQAVTYITQRMESLAALFVLAGLLCFVRAAHASRVPQRAMAFAGSAVCLVLGYAAKETALVLPLLALLVDWFWLAAGDFRSLRRRWWMHAALLLCMLVLAAKTLHLLGGFVPAGQVAGGTAKATAGFAVTSISAWEYALTQTNVLLYYIGLVVFPVNQNLDYDYPVARDLLSWPSVREGTILNWPPLPPLLALLAIVALLAGAVIWYRRAGCRSQAARLTLFGLLWYLVAVAPTSSVIPVIDVIYEHRAYLASVGLLLIVTTALKGVSERLPFRSLPSRPGA